MHNLDEDALVEILTEPKNALVKQYQKFFEFDGVELEFTDDALEAIAEQSIHAGDRRPRLARDHRRGPAQRDVRPPSREDVGKCLIDREVVLTR